METIFELNSVLKEKGRKRKKHRFHKEKHQHQCLAGTLASANINEEYIIKTVETSNDEMKNFLFSLGCYEGERITIISIISEQYIIVLKDARYSIDKNLASAIII